MPAGRVRTSGGGEAEEGTRPQNFRRPGTTGAMTPHSGRLSGISGSISMDKMPRARTSITIHKSDNVGKNELHLSQVHRLSDFIVFECLELQQLSASDVKKVLAYRTQLRHRSLVLRHCEVRFEDFARLMHVGETESLVELMLYDCHVHPAVPFEYILAHLGYKSETLPNEPPSRRTKKLIVSASHGGNVKLPENVAELLLSSVRIRENCDKARFHFSVLQLFGVSFLNRIAYKQFVVENEQLSPTPEIEAMVLISFKETQTGAGNEGSQQQELCSTQTPQPMPFRPRPSFWSLFRSRRKYGSIEIV